MYIVCTKQFVLTLIPNSTLYCHVQQRMNHGIPQNTEILRPTKIRRISEIKFVSVKSEESVTPRRRNKQAWESITVFQRK